MWHFPAIMRIQAYRATIMKKRREFSADSTLLTESESHFGIIEIFKSPREI
jgi:hypothetical protein